VRGFRGLLSIALIASIAVPSRARGDDTCAAEARVFDRTDPSLSPPRDRRAAQHVREGNKRHRVLKYAEAIEEYVAAALLDPAPSIHYNLGQSYRLSGQYENAIRQYRLFIDRGTPRETVRRLVECHIASMTAELERAVSTAPPTGPAPDAVSELTPAEATLDVATTTAAQQAPWYADRIGLGLAGIGVVAAGAGTWLLVDAAGLDDDANHEDRDDVRVDLRSRADSRRTWGVVATGVGAAVLVAGIVKLAITPERVTEGRVSLLLSPSSVGLQGRF
jgi:hypothetical protein